ncbi:hypothetical protein [Serinicoccus profundi]|uniref:hypothetical protein n=1 Tax=Serinicoccus profundi TaxID=1078471 RepID=UPI0002D49482|nr:hypothetical protein [Serinicoccus profundi]
MILPGRPSTPRTSSADQAEGHLTDEIASEPEQVRRCETLPGSTFPFTFPLPSAGS